MNEVVHEINLPWWVGEVPGINDTTIHERNGDPVTTVKSGYGVEWDRFFAAHIVKAVNAYREPPVPE